jgi:hypothetical protein
MKNRPFHWFVLFFFVTSLLLKTNSASGHWYGQPVVLKNEPDRMLLIEGILTTATLLEVQEKTANWIPEIVRISSGGGNADVAFEIGRLISIWGAVLEIKGPCLSTCAEHLFPQAITTRVLPLAVVAFRVFEPDTLQNAKDKKPIAVKQYGVAGRIRRHVDRFANEHKTAFAGRCQNDHTFWLAPAPSDWIALGLVGNQVFWYPSNNSDFRAIRSLYFPDNDAIGFFSLKELAKACSVGVPKHASVKFR